MTSLVTIAWEQIDLSGSWHVDHSNKQDRPQLLDQIAAKPKREIIFICPFKVTKIEGNKNPGYLTSLDNKIRLGLKGWRSGSRGVSWQAVLKSIQNLWQLFFFN